MLGFFGDNFLYLVLGAFALFTLVVNYVSIADALDRR